MRRLFFVPLVGVILAATFGSKPAMADALDECLDSLLPDEAVAACTEALNWTNFSNEQRAMLLVQRADGFVLNDENAAALSDFNAAIALDPYNHMARHGRGTLLLATNEYDAAIKDFDIAIAVRPDYMPAFHNRGYAYEKLRRYDEAIADFSVVIALEPNLAKAFNNRGVAYRKCGDTGRAMMDFSRAIELQPRYAQAYVNRAATFLDYDSRADAIIDYRAALAIDAASEAATAGLKALVLLR